MMLSVEEYKAMSQRENLPSDDAIEKAIKEAEEDVNIMTYGRIYARGFNTLSTFQQEKVKLAIARQVDFRSQYSDLLSNPLSSYSINGVSMNWDKSVLTKSNGVYTSQDVAGVLNQTGLTYRGVY
jgi:hypothetical protein